MGRPMLDAQLIKERQATVETFYKVLSVNGKTFQTEFQKSLKPYTSFIKKFCTKGGTNENLRPFGTLSFKSWQKIKNNCEAVITIDRVLEKYDFVIGNEGLLADFKTQIDRKKILNAITLIDKCIECGRDSTEDRAVIRSGICPELDNLR